MTVPSEGNDRYFCFVPLLHRATITRTAGHAAERVSARQAMRTLRQKLNEMMATSAGLMDEKIFAGVHSVRQTLCDKV